MTVSDTFFDDPSEQRTMLMNALDEDERRENEPAGVLHRLILLAFLAVVLPLYAHTIWIIARWSWRLIG